MKKVASILEMTLLVYVCIGVALQSTMGTLACGSKCKCAPKKCPIKPPPPPIELPCPPPSNPNPTPAPATSTCSIDYKELGSCAPLLGGILGIGSQCCGLLGLLDLDVVACLCLALDVNVLGIIDIKVNKLDAIVSILTSCNKTVPKNLSCPS